MITTVQVSIPESAITPSDLTSRAIKINIPDLLYKTALLNIVIYYVYVEINRYLI